MHAAGADALAEPWQACWMLRLPVPLVTGQFDLWRPRQTAYVCVAQALAPEWLAQWLASVRLNATTRDRR